MRKILLTLVFLSLNVSAENVTPVTLKTFIKNLGDIRADIEQTKYVKAINKSFTTSSSVDFKKNIGVTWKDQEHTFVANKKYFKIDNHKSKEVTELSYFGDIKEIVDSVLSGDIDALKEIFDITYGPQLILVPNISEISDWIAKITVDMTSTEIKEVKIYYSNGNIISLKFKNENNKAEPKKQSKRKK